MNSPNWLWTYYLLREFTVSFSWMHSEPNNLTLDSILITWIDYLFRESTMNQLSSSWLYYESTMKVWYFFQFHNRSIIYISNTLWINNLFLESTIDTLSFSRFRLFFSWNHYKSLSVSSIHYESIMLLAI